MRVTVVQMRYALLSRLGRSMEARVFHLLAKEPLPFQLATCLSQLKRVVKEALIGSILGVRET